MKRRNIMILMISLSLVLLLGSSYALLRSTEVGSTPYVINVGSLQVTFDDDKTDKLTLENMYPMSDDEGSSRSEELSFVVKNTGNIEARYNVYLEELSNTPVFKDHIRFIVKKNNHDYSNPKTLGSNKYIDANAYLNTNQSATYQVKLWLDREADNTYMSDETSTKEFKAKVVIEGIQNTNEYDLYDLSGNNFYNAKFMNGTKIITDENSRKAISFDGEDDYVDVDDIPAEVDFASGFIVEFEAEWNVLNNWSRIFDFGVGKEQDNIFVSIFTANPSLGVAVWYNKTENRIEVPNVITIGEILKFKIIYDKKETGYELRIYKNNELVYTTNYEIENLISNVLRTNNYLGRSNWESDKYFKGLIYNLKITDSKGTPIIWYDLNW